MDFFSTLQKPFQNFGELFQFDTRLRRIWAVSAYYDEDSIEQLIQHLEEQGAGNARLELVIILDRRVSNVNALKSLDKDIRKKFTHEDSGIYLCSEGELFHSKGYLAETAKDGICLLGSLNLTQKGLTRNDEILASARYSLESRSKETQLAEKFAKYVSSIWDDLDRIGDRKREGEQFKPKHLTDLLLDGAIYYETRESSPFGFPLNLPEKFLETDSPINDVLESKTSDVVNVCRLLARICPTDVPVRPTEKSHWKRFCIQTCYGFWTPSDFIENIDHSLLCKSGLNAYYEQIAQLLNANKDLLRCEILSLCDEIYSKMNELGMSGQWPFVVDGVLDTDKLEKKWDQWFETLAAKLESEAFKQRLVCNVRHTKMPNIWEDPEAVSDFEDSFFESLAYKLTKHNTRNVIARNYRQNVLECSELSEAAKKDYKIALTEFLANGSEFSPLTSIEE